MPQQILLRKERQAHKTLLRIPHRNWKASFWSAARNLPMPPRRAMSWYSGNPILELAKGFEPLTL